MNSIVFNLVSFSVVCAFVLLMLYSVSMFMNPSIDDDVVENDDESDDDGGF